VSVESLAIALNHSKAKGSAKIIMMGIANHDGDGGAWPAIDTLAKYANVTRRNARDAIQRLVELGEIEVVLHGGGGDSLAFTHRPNLYKVLLRCPPDCDRTSQHRTSRRRSVQVDLDPGSLSTPHVEFDPSPGSMASPSLGSLSTPEPPYKPTTRLNKERHHSAREERECPVSERISPNGRHVDAGTGICLNCGSTLKKLVNT
jgi:hypothetical protein